MSGREKIKVFQYNRVGRFIRSYQSISEVRDLYYPDTVGKYPMFVKNEEYHLLPDDTIVVKHRIYRDDVVKMFYRMDNPLIFTENDIDPIDVFNMDGDLIATFINPRTASILTGFSDASIYSSLNRRTGMNMPKNRFRISFKRTPND